VSLTSAKMLAKAFALVSYVYFFWSLPLQASAFMVNLPQILPWVSDTWFPYSMDHNAALFGDLQTRVLVNVALLGLFAIPHSIFARPSVKRSMPIAPQVYRSFYVFKSSACLHLLLKFWQPLDSQALWDFSEDPRIPLVLYSAGWLWLVTSTFALDHFELFGLKDGLGVDFMNKLGFGSDADTKLTERLHYKLCRHPIMLGFFVMFFAVPTMTITHLVFSSACTAYILLAVKFLEEPDLQAEIGDAYSDYKERVPMYCPFMGGSGPAKKKQ
jgi:protein-S-isoprenylcysteine O-methyltransferase Ste14